MKSVCIAFTGRRRTLYVSVFFSTLAVLNGLGNETRASLLKNAPLSLPRLSPQAHLLGEKPLHKDAFEVLEIASLPDSDKAKLDERHGVPYLQIEGGEIWHQKLKSHSSRVSYITFTLNGSIGTKINIGGASLVVEPSERDLAYAAIKTRGPSGRIIHETPWLLYNGRRMAPLSIVTIQVNRKSHTWSIWFRDMLLASDIPLETQTHSIEDFEVVAGKGGVWLCGLVNSSENPLFEDFNDNAVPDEFEEKTLGRKLEGDATSAAKNSLRKEWLKDKLARAPAQFVLTSPLPDNFPEDCAPEGEFVHGMQGGLKFGAPIKKNN
jgi:hypothetical protein